MSEEVIDTQDAGTQDTSTAALPPSSEQSNAAATTGTTAPPANAAREAFDRLVKGDRPEDVNRDYRAKQSTPSAGKDAGTQATKEKSGEQTPAPEPSQAASNGWPDGTSEKDMRVLQRAKMDPEAWKHIPPSNRAKILNGLRTSQAEADRQFAAAKAAKKGGQQAAATQTPPEAEDSATPGETGDEAHADEGQAHVEQQQQQQRATPAAKQAAAAQQSYLTPAHRETLQMLGGDDLAETMDHALAQVHQQNQQQMAPLVGVLEYLLGQHIDGQFNSAVSELAKTPGFESLSSGEKAKENQTALRQKALLLHRAAGDPVNYPFSEAVKDAAASLFKLNLQQASQARLLQQRTASLRGAPDKGDGTRNTPRALDSKERGRQIFQNLQQGMDPVAARRAVDGA